ncbi:putative zn2+-binding protein melusin contains chord domain [Diaporthe ampelina]|uniref:Putative zn2+-binding protein melusin contains chord domain n=1 Tax=Diaporthe ampelina TaxID=1214573 RepID=A0A0G2FRP5_9PEZI|nr:putative zn2+-binding protein melusin contains chord domain [Diaporthe ampelina]
MDRFSSRRLDNIKRNQEVLQELGAVAQAEAIHRSSHPVKAANGAEDARAAKRRRVEKPRAPAAPTRTSARIASAPVRPSYDEDDSAAGAVAGTKTQRAKAPRKGGTPAAGAHDEDRQSPGPQGSELLADIDALRASWSSWTPSAPPPSRDETGVLHFASHPDFTPNKTPAEVLREGAFGGSYFRPLYSKKLRTTVSGDHAELPADWTAGLDAGRYLAAREYDADANKFKVACGQSM